LTCPCRSCRSKVNRMAEAASRAAKSRSTERRMSSRGVGRSRVNPDPRKTGSRRSSSAGAPFRLLKASVSWRSDWQALPETTPGIVAFEHVFGNAALSRASETVGQTRNVLLPDHVRRAASSSSTGTFSRRRQRPNIRAFLRQGGVERVVGSREIAAKRLDLVGRRQSIEFEQITRRRRTAPGLQPHGILNELGTCKSRLRIQSPFATSTMPLQYSGRLSPSMTVRSRSLTMTCSCLSDPVRRGSENLFGLDVDERNSVP